jgi:hypothetical protein
MISKANMIRSQAFDFEINCPKFAHHRPFMPKDPSKIPANPLLTLDRGLRRPCPQRKNGGNIKGRPGQGPPHYLGGYDL